MFFFCEEEDGIRFLTVTGFQTCAFPILALITAGSAFASAGVQRRVAEALERASRRRVVLLDAPVSARDAAVKDLAARLIREDPSILGYDRRGAPGATPAGGADPAPPPGGRPGPRSPPPPRASRPPP